LFSETKAIKSPEAIATSRKAVTAVIKGREGREGRRGGGGEEYE